MSGLSSAMTAQGGAGTRRAPFMLRPQGYIPAGRMRSPEEVLAQAMQGPMQVPLPSGSGFSPILVQAAPTKSQSLAAALGGAAGGQPAAAQRPIFGVGSNI